MGDIFNVQLLHGRHLWWPSLDVDLHVDALADPARFPLLSGRRPGRRKNRR